MNQAQPLFIGELNNEYTRCGLHESKSLWAFVYKFHLFFEHLKMQV